jgi:hypothetical protein
VAINDKVHIISIQHSQQLTDLGQINPVARYTYKVSKAGPFVHDFPLGNDDVDTVQKFFDGEVAKYTALGVVS